MTHYYDETQQGPFEPFLIPIRLPDRLLEINSAHGVFSKKHLDNGTETMLKYMDLDNVKTVLDLGCGYGIIGLVVKLRNPELEVTQSDVNERALQLTRMNTKKFNISTKIIKSDLYQKLGKFDLILVNPPYVAGRELIFKLITEAKDHLNKGGSLQLVARHNKGGKVLSQKMEEIFGNMIVLGMKSGFRVYCSKLEND